MRSPQVGALGGDERGQPTWEFRRNGLTSTSRPAVRPRRAAGRGAAAQQEADPLHIGWAVLRVATFPRSGLGDTGMRLEGRVSALNFRSLASSPDSGIREQSVATPARSSRPQALLCGRRDRI